MANAREEVAPRSKDDTGKGEGLYHVNKDREGRVKSNGEDLLGREILSRAGLNSDKYELWTEVGGKVGSLIPPDENHFTKPGDHFRATIGGTDYSCAELLWGTRT